jgi:hypothetical protein
MVLVTIWLILMALLGIFSLFVVPLETDYSRIIQMMIGTFQLLVTILMISILLFGWYKATIWLMNFYLKKPIILSENTEN